MLYKLILDDYNKARVDRAQIETRLLSTLIGDAQTKAKNRGVEFLSDQDMVALVKSYIANIRTTTEALGSNEGTEYDPDRVHSLFVMNYELSVLSGYLPKQLSEPELTTIITDYVNAKKLEGAKVTLGDVMAYLKGYYAGQYDGKVASTIAKTLV